MRAAERGVTAMTAWTLFLGVLFGSIGLGFFIYGRKQRKVVPLLCGLMLMILPYFIPDTLLLFLAGAVLVAVPYFIRM
jgi:hypothetical protein